MFGVRATVWFLKRSFSSSTPAVSESLLKWHSALRKVAPPRKLLLPEPLGSAECDKLAILGDCLLKSAVVEDLFLLPFHTPGSITCYSSHVLSNAVLSEEADKLLVISGIDVSSEDLKTLSVHDRATCVEAAVAAVRNVLGTEPILFLARVLLDLRAPPFLCGEKEFLAFGGQIAIRGPVVQASFKHYVADATAASVEQARKAAILKLLALLGSDMLRKQGSLAAPSKDTDDVKVLASDVSKPQQAEQSEKVTQLQPNISFVDKVTQLGGTFTFCRTKHISQLKFGKKSFSSSKVSEPMHGQYFLAQQLVSQLRLDHQTLSDLPSEDSKAVSEKPPLPPLVSPIVLLWKVKSKTKKLGGFRAKVKLNGLVVRSEAILQHQAERLACRTMLANIIADLQAALLQFELTNKT